MNYQVETVAKRGKLLVKYLLVVLMIFYGYAQLEAQSNKLNIAQKTDSALFNAVRHYDRAIGRNSFLFTGRVYVDKYNSIEGHQFFQEDYWDLGEIVYEGQHFDSVYLMYDIYNHELLLEHFNTNGALAPIKLYNSKISSFKLQGNTFIKIEEDSLTGLAAGFYDKLFLGEHLGIYVYRRKDIYKTTSTNSVAEVFRENDKFYLKKNGDYYQIRSTGNIKKVLMDHKKEIKKFIRSNGLFYRQDPERTLLLVAQYYENLEN